jgi:hypothetical protein
MERVRVVGQHDKRITDVVFRPGTHEALSASEDGTIRRWNVDTPAEIGRYQLHSGPVRALALSPADGTVVSAGEDGAIVQWEMETSRRIRGFSGHTARVNSIAFSDDGRWIVSGANDGTVRIWDVASGAQRRQFSLAARQVPSVAFSGDSRRVAACCGKEAIVWDAVSGQELQRLQGHTSSISRVQLSWSGKYAATGSDDRTVRMWEVGNGREVFRLNPFPSLIADVHYLLGVHLMAASSDGTIRGENVPAHLVDSKDPAAAAAVGTAAAQTKRASPPPTPAAARLAGTVRFRIVGYPTQGDPQTLAREAVSGIAWADPASVTIDRDKNEVVIGLRVMSLNTAAAKASLEQRGFRIGGVTVQPLSPPGV